MMEVWKLTNNRIYFGEEEFYRINIDIITEFSLKEKMKLDEEKSRMLFVQLILFRAYSYLLRKDYTRKELKFKLSQEFPKTSPIEEVLDLLEEKAYIDDYSYAKNFIESKGQSKKKNFYDLSIRGVKKELIDEVYSEIEFDEKEDIRALLPKLQSKDERKRVEYLLRKGYNLKDILEVLKEEH